jgi:hypothetical protein
MITEDLFAQIMHIARQQGFKAEEIGKLNVVDKSITPINSVSWDEEEQVIVLS